MVQRQADAENGVQKVTSGALLGCASDSDSNDAASGADAAESAERGFDVNESPLLLSADGSCNLSDERAAESSAQLASATKNGEDDSEGCCGVVGDSGGDVLLAMSECLSMTSTTDGCVSVLPSDEVAEEGSGMSSAGGGGPTPLSTSVRADLRKIFSSCFFRLRTPASLQCSTPALVHCICGGQNSHGMCSSLHHADTSRKEGGRHGVPGRQSMQEGS